MKLTEQLKAWMVENVKLTTDASDDDFKSAVADALIEGTLPREKYVELTKDADADKHDRLTEMLAAMQKTNELLAKRLEALESGKPDDADTKSPKNALKSPLDKIISKAAGGDSPDVRVKGAWEGYDSTKSAAVYPNMKTSNGEARKHPLAGQQVVDGTDKYARPLDNLSELEKAASGVFWKWCLAFQPRNGELPQGLRFVGDARNPKGETHDEQLLLWALHEAKWGGTLRGVCETERAESVRNQKLTPMQIKQVIDDTSSGGQYITPIFFDDNVVLPTLLYGEFYPYVSVTTVTRGRRVESGTIGEFTVNSGGGDGTTITLTTTSSFISAFNTTIFTADMGIELGLDFLSDSPVDLAGILTRQAGEKMMQWLDEQICVGDGTTEPEGITVASGTTSVSHSNAAPTIGVYVQHLLNVGKEYTQNTAMNRLMFGGTQTSYRRARSIAVGASDARLIFGNSGLGSYTLFDGYPYGINSNLGNTKVFFGNMSRYRMYRRLGMEVRTSTEGKTLMRDNLMLMLARFRFGGQVEDGAAWTVATDAQA